MKTDDEALRQIGPRIKLLKRHVQELTALLKLQNEAIRLINNEAILLNPSPPDHTLATIQLIAEKASRLNQLRVRQSTERQEMKVRHYQEEDELEQALNARE